MFHDAAILLIAWSPWVLRLCWKWFQNHTMRQVQRCHVEEVLDRLKHRNT